MKRFILSLLIAMTLSVSALAGGIVIPDKAKALIALDYSSDTTLKIVSSSLYYIVGGSTDDTLIISHQADGWLRIDAGSGTSITAAIDTILISGDPIGDFAGQNLSVTSGVLNASVWRPYLDVTNFGAVGDSTTDDGTAIQAALDSAGVLGGATVFFPRGTYRVISSMMFDSNTHILGTIDSKLFYEAQFDSITDGCALLARSFDTTAAGAFFITKNVIIENLTVETTADSGNGIGIVRCDNVILRNIRCGQVEHHAIDITGSNNVLVEGCFFRGTQSAAIQIDNATNGGALGRAFGGDSAISMPVNSSPEHSRNIVVDGNRIVNCIRGVHFHRVGGGNIVVSNNTFDSCGTSTFGAIHGDSNGDLTDWFNVSITGNVFNAQDSDRTAIYLFNSNPATIMYDGLNIIGNVIMGGQYGILVSGSYGVNISDNIIDSLKHDVDSSSVRAITASHISGIISHNVISNIGYNLAGEGWDLDTAFNTRSESMGMNLSLDTGLVVDGNVLTNIYGVGIGYNSTGGYGIISNNWIENTGVGIRLNDGAGSPTSLNIVNNSFMAGAFSWFGIYDSTSSTTLSLAGNNFYGTFGTEQSTWTTNENYNMGNYSLPNVDGSSNQILKTDGSGVLSWTNSAGGFNSISFDTTDNGTPDLITTDSVAIRAGPNVAFSWTNGGNERELTISASVSGGTGALVKVEDQAYVDSVAFLGELGVLIRRVAQTGTKPESLAVALDTSSSVYVDGIENRIDDSLANYLDLAGTQVMTGTLQMNGNDISNVEKLNTVDTIGFSGGDIVFQIGGDSLNSLTGLGLEATTAAPSALRVTDWQALSDAKDTVALWDNGINALMADLGPFIDTTTLDTIQNAMKADTALHAQEIYNIFYNITGATLPKGTPVYVSGFNVGANLTEIDSARADNAAFGPAIGILHDDILNADSGAVIEDGDVEDQVTNTFSINDVLYVGATGGLTATKPTGTNYVQAIGLVIRSHPTQGIIEVVNSGHVEDLPNIASANFWLGNASGVPTAVVMSGDATMDNAGAVTIGQHVVDTSDLNVTNVGTGGQLLSNGSGGNMIWINPFGILGSGTPSDEDQVNFITSGDIAFAISTVGDPNTMTASYVSGSILSSDINLSAGITAGQLADTYYESDGTGTASGTWNLGGLARLEIPNSPSPATTIEGQIAWDTGDDWLEVFDGTQSVVIAQKLKFASMTINDPDNLANDTVMFLAVEAEWAPSGITVDSYGIKTRAASTYSVIFSEYTQPDNGGVETVLDATPVATSSSTEAEDDGSIDNTVILQGNLVMVELPATDIDQVLIWMTFFINDN